MNSSSKAKQLISKSEQRATTRKRRPSALSLKKIHNKLEDIEVTTVHEDNSNKPKDSFSEKVLIEKWTQFGKQLEAEEDLNLASIVNAGRPTLKNNEITYILPNKLMEEQFGAVKSKLMNYLKTSLNNFSIQVKTIVLETQEKKYVYTPQEKFQKLVDSNPDVLLLKKTFGLDI